VLRRGISWPANCHASFNGPCGHQWPQLPLGQEIALGRRGAAAARRITRRAISMSSTTVWLRGMEGLRHRAHRSVSRWEKPPSAAFLSAWGAVTARVPCPSKLDRPPIHREAPKLHRSWNPKPQRCLKTGIKVIEPCSPLPPRRKGRPVWGGAGRRQNGAASRS